MGTDIDNTAAELEFAALCPAGFEEPLAQELHGLGARRIRPLRGSVSFYGDLACAYRVCLWARLASRVTLVLGRYPVASIDELYEAAKAFPWERHIGENATIAVEARGGNDGVRDMRFATLRVKDAICDRLRELRGSRPFVDVDRPDVRIVATVRANKTLFSLDLGGGSLIDHGYRVPSRGRVASGRAGFVREDMADLLLGLADWTKVCRRNNRAHLVDPLGTSPALDVEAACIAADRAPRLVKRYWGFTGWLGHDAQAWDEILSDAQAARAMVQKAAAGADANDEDASQSEGEALEGSRAAQAASAPQLFHTIDLPGDAGQIDVLVPASDQFAARLHKAAKAAGKWARRENISCYRIYDADLPDYAVSIDLYQGSDITPGRWVVMSEYAAPRGIDQNLAQRRLADALAITPRVLGVDPENVFLKVRRHSKGGSQYSERVRQGRTALVEEGGLLFEVNFSDYLDTGLFLDHRIVRSMIAERASRVRFLNLFAYTGAASCYAAAGDAYQTTTVDMSKTYLAWAQRNMEQNGFSGPMHEYVQADVMPWISQQRRTGNRWDLIYIDPPTFSNSARMHKRGFDVQVDHSELIIGASRLLTRTGSIIFSCNLRGFEPDLEKLDKAGIELEDVTASTIPRDFERNARIHHCYLARRVR